jgi:hypothetical protein
MNLNGTLELGIIGKNVAENGKIIFEIMKNDVNIKK